MTVSVIIPCKTSKTVSVENTVRVPETGVYSRPLGSPTRGLKRSYVHVPVDLGTGVLVHRGDGPGGCTGLGMGNGWVYRVGNTGYTQPPHAARGASPDSEAGPGRPWQGLEWVVWVQRARVPGPPFGPGRSGPVLPSLSRYPLSSQTAVQTSKRRHFTTFYWKLVKTTKCRPFSSIRPVIVPVSKTGSKSRLLRFSDFHFGQPSLTRNY